jgi:hypothetical protein
MASHPSRPDLSVVVVTPERFANVRRTVRHLRSQTVRERIELVLMAPEEAALADRAADELEGFHSVTIVPVGCIDNVDRAGASGLLRGRAPVVALIEDHAFPEPDWAERLLPAWARGPWAAVGSAILNANPATALSWSNLLIAYGPWDEARPAGEIEWVPAHNISLRRDLLEPYGPRLADKLGREGQLLQELAGAGHRFAFEPQARIRHVNPSSLASTAALRFDAGRLYAARRAEAENWSALKRTAYVIGGPLIPGLRFARLRRELFGGGRRRELVPRVYPGLMLGLVLDAAGQMAGYALGAGHAPQRLAVFEMDRWQHLSRRDRAALAAT